ncbi:phosphatase 2C 16-like protein [Tanacetum coccineum]|uniref:Phosphatase 2C 16-like protein n=1 Tax=Tanacetum coccineum TaxID=301880 RepID=A0ABQ4WRI2_9ASTR
MEEIATFSLANSLSENTSLSNHVSFTRVKLLTEPASLLSDMGSKTVSNEDSTLNQANLVKVPLVVANSSVIGKRPEMEDAVAVVPRFMEVPIKMFVGDHVVDGVNSSLTSLTTHFFGVYDGHGGSQDNDLGGFNAKKGRLEDFGCSGP